MSRISRISVVLLLLLLIGVLLLITFSKDDTALTRSYEEVLKEEILSKLKLSIEKSSDSAESYRIEFDYYINNRSELIAFYNALEHSTPHTYDDYFSDTYSSTPALPPRDIRFPDFDIHFSIAPNLLILFMQKGVFQTLVFELTEEDYEKIFAIIRSLDWY